MIRFGEKKKMQENLQQFYFKCPLPEIIIFNLRDILIRDFEKNM